MEPIYVVIAVVVLIAVFWAMQHERQRRIALQPYWDRSCQGKEWKSAFPDSTAIELRAFLTLFVDCFGFKGRNSLKFSPSDKLLDIYRASNPDKSAPDILEMETFGRELQDRYGLRLADIWYDGVTLGDVYKRANAA